MAEEECKYWKSKEKALKMAWYQTQKWDWIKKQKTTIFHFKTPLLGTSVVVQWLSSCFWFTSSIPDQGYMLQLGINEQTKKNLQTL